MFRQRNFILKQLALFNVDCTTGPIYKNGNCLRSLHLGVTYLNKELKPISSNIENVQGDKQLNFRALADTYGKIHFQNVTSDEGHLLLQCCGKSTFNSSQKERNEVCQSIYGNLAKYNKLDISIYNTYIQVCTENRTLLNYQTFLENLKCEPHHQTYMLLFQNVCECGDMNQAVLLLEIMKNEKIPLDEIIFNNLVLVHTLNGGIEAAERVLGTMKTAQVLETSQTHVAILKGIVRSKNHKDFKNFLEKYPVRLDEDQLLVILKDLGVSQSVNWLPEMKPLFNNLVVTRAFINNLKNVCIHLVHMNQPDSAIKMFNYFQQEPEENYGFFILEEMLHSNLDSSDIISAVIYLRDNDLNEYIFENVAGVALKNEYFDMAWKLFEHLKELRPHFFWPFFLNAKTVEGEAGIFKVLEQAKKMRVSLDLDSLEHYIIPFCNHDDVKSLVEKLKKSGFTVKTILAALLHIFLKDGKVEIAAEICQHYHVRIGGVKLFHLICSSWITTKSPHIVTVLQKYCEFKNVEDDLVGDFLVSSIESCRSNEDFQAFLRVLKTVYEAKLKITTTSADILRGRLQEELEDTGKELCEEILDGIDKVLAFKLKAEKNYISHPRDMTVEDLECHLVELLEKNMETRGTLRRLIQMHMNLGNMQRVEELRKDFLEAGYEETLGMKSSLMYTYIKSDNIESALNTYNELKTIAPKFAIDHYKVIDLAALLVKNDKISEAMSVLEGIECRLEHNPEKIQRNCVELLNTFKDEKEQKTMFNFLISKGFCKINNIMLGPLVKIFLTRGDLDKATNTYTNLASTYKCTPLQFELVREIALSRNEEMLQKVLDITTEVRGPVSTQVVLIAVLAEIGEENILTKLFATTKIPIQKELKKRCDRWIKEGKCDALLTLANSCNRLPPGMVDLDYIYQCIIKTFAINNDCAAAVRFYETLLEKDIPVDKRLENELYKFLRQNNYSVPPNLRRHNKS